MKKIWIVLFIVLAFAFAAAAHPPSAINVTADTKTMTVKVDVVHQVKDPGNHFIHEIILKVNGKIMIKQEATEQITAQSQSVVYVVPGLKAGDIISVTGDCSKFGDLTVEYAVKDAPVKPQETKKPSSKPVAGASSKLKAE